MKDLRQILSALQKSSSPEDFLATIVETKGSVYRRPGARMFIHGNETVGAVSGGCLEQDLCEHAKTISKSKIIHYDMMSEEDILWGLGMGCNGEVKVLLQPITESSRMFWNKISTHVQQGHKITLATIFSESESNLDAQSIAFSTEEEFGELENPELDKEIRNKYVQVSRTSKQRNFLENSQTNSNVKILWEFIHPVRLIICGGGYDAIPLANFAHNLGWDVLVTDWREIYANSERFPSNPHILVSTPQDLKLDSLRFAKTAVVIMSHHYLRDQEYAKLFSQENIDYLGMLGPKRRSERIFTELQKDHPDIQVPKFLYSPVGLDLGAETAEEIALSIVAEVQKFLQGSSGKNLKDREGPIHVI